MGNWNKNPSNIDTCGISKNIKLLNRRFVRQKGNERLMDREQTTIRLPAELKDKLHQEAEAKGYSVTDLIIFILWAYFQITTLQE